MYKHFCYPFDLSLVAARADHVFSETKTHQHSVIRALPTGTDHTEAGRGGNIPRGHTLLGSGDASATTRNPPDGCRVKPAWPRPPDRLWWRSHSAVRLLRSDGRGTVGLLASDSTGRA